MLIQIVKTTAKALGVQCLLCNGSLSILNPSLTDGITNIDAGNTSLTITTTEESADLLLSNESARMYVEGFIITSRRDASGIELIHDDAYSDDAFNLWGNRINPDSEHGFIIQSGRKILKK